MQILFEHPLNEYVRNLLRMEYLFQQAEQAISDDCGNRHRDALNWLVQIVELATRSDLRVDLGKNLARNLERLETLEAHDSVDSDKLRSYRRETAETLAALRDSQYQPGRLLQTNELVQSLKQRLYILGGMCSFDLPSLHYWLHEDGECRRQMLRDWKGDLLPIEQAVDLCLMLLRDSGAPSPEIALAGSLQKDLGADAPKQLVRVFVDRAHCCYAEISGNKHRISIRFMQRQDAAARPSQMDRDIPFELSCCSK